jgi:catechol 2,3-dioxygenase-like lactoylglutathione lyase family enzyme
VPDVLLDHVAVAVEHWSDAWPRYAVELGGAWSSGGANIGFAPAQLRFANEGRLEILQPWQPESNPFLRRFLDRHGPGPHHLTFKVPDLANALDAARDAGVDPIGVDLRHPDWKEAFIHPHQATGIVVQMAQAAHSWESPAPEGFPAGSGSPPASLLRVTHAVADLDLALALFEGLLGGRVRRHSTDPAGWEFADLEWQGPPALRLVSPAAAIESPSAHTLREWLDRRPGRTHHLAFSLPVAATARQPARPASAPGSPATPILVPGVVAPEVATRVIEPDENLGVRLVLLDEPPAAATSLDDTVNGRP